MKTLLLILLCIASGFASAAMPAVGMPFMAARKLLIAHGWRPDSSYRSRTLPYDPVERDLRKRRVRELESCAMDRPLCLFHYRKAGQCLRLMTEGEQVADMKVLELRKGCEPPS